MEQNEPSMEEILSSIRRILSKEENKPEEIIKTEKESTEISSVPVDPDIMQLTPQMRVDAGNKVEPKETISEPSISNKTRFDDMELLSEATVQASKNSFSDLFPVKENTKQENITPSFSKTTLEDVVLTALKPLLKEWLDKNLPELVEKIVQREVKNITRQIQDS